MSTIYPSGEKITTKPSRIELRREIAATLEVSRARPTVAMPAY